MPIVLPLKGQLENGDEVHARRQAELCKRHVQELLPKLLLPETFEAEAGCEQNIEVRKKDGG